MIKEHSYSFFGQLPNNPAAQIASESSLCALVAPKLHALLQKCIGPVVDASSNLSDEGKPS